MSFLICVSGCCPPSFRREREREKETKTQASLTIARIVSHHTQVKVTKNISSRLFFCQDSLSLFDFIFEAKLLPFGDSWPAQLHGCHVTRHCGSRCLLCNIRQQMATVPQRLKLCGSRDAIASRSFFLAASWNTQNHSNEPRKFTNNRHCDCAVFWIYFPYFNSLLLYIILWLYGNYM